MHSPSGVAVLVTFLPSLVVTRALAQEDPPPPFQIQADLGLVSAAGNSEVTTLNIGERLTVNRDRFSFTQDFSVVYGRSGDSITTNQWKASLRQDVQLAGPVGVFVRGSFERNTTAGISRRFEEALGIATRIIEQERTSLNAEVGAALNQQRSTTDVSNSFASMRLAADLKQFVSESAYLTEHAELLPNLEDGDDVRVNSETALVAPISARIALKLSYTIKFDNVPEPGFEKTDRILSAGVQVVF